MKGPGNSPSFSHEAAGGDPGPGPIAHPGRAPFRHVDGGLGGGGDQGGTPRGGGRDPPVGPPLRGRGVRLLLGGEQRQIRGDLGPLPPPRSPPARGLGGKIGCAAAQLPPHHRGEVEPLFPAASPDQPSARLRADKWVPPGTLPRGTGVRRADPSHGGADGHHRGGGAAGEGGGGHRRRAVCLGGPLRHPGRPAGAAQDRRRPGGNPQLDGMLAGSLGQRGPGLPPHGGGTPAPGHRPPPHRALPSLPHSGRPADGGRGNGRAIPGSV